MAACGSGRSSSFTPAVPVARSVATIAFIVSLPVLFENSCSLGVFFLTSSDSFLLFAVQHRVALYVNPLVGFRRGVAAEAVLLVVSRHLLVRCIGFEQGPAPAVAPQRIIGISAF